MLVADTPGMHDAPWNATTSYLRLLGAGEYEAGTDLLATALDRDGEGAIADALVDCCRSLMEHIVFEAGIIDVRAALDEVAERTVMAAADTRVGAFDDARAVLVFAGSEGLPCAARTTVANWPAHERLRNFVACTIGLVGTVARNDGRTVAEVATELTRPKHPEPAAGTFDLAGGATGRSWNAAPRIAFVAEKPASLRAILTRVALLRAVAIDPDATSDATNYTGIGEMLGMLVDNPL
jgi:hypothetical protein